MTAAFFCAWFATFTDTTEEVLVDHPEFFDSAMELNSTGTLFTVVSWAVLLSLNLWCFRRLLSCPQPAAHAEQARD